MSIAFLSTGIKDVAVPAGFDALSVDLRADLPIVFAVCCVSAGALKFLVEQLENLAAFPVRVASPRSEKRRADARFPIPVGRVTPAGIQRAR